MISYGGSSRNGFFFGLYRRVSGASLPFNEHYWRCVICGYRGYEQVPRPKSKADIIEEKVWDEVLDALDKEENPTLICLS